MLKLDAVDICYQVDARRWVAKLNYRAWTKKNLRRQAKGAKAEHNENLQ